MVGLAEHFVEEEFFYSGTAHTLAPAGGATAPYKTRFLIRRPKDPADFNGTVFFEWNNVTIPHDHDATWQNYWKTTFSRGYVYISVAAQLLSVEASPLALKQWDPVRYGSLAHPGDDYSFDIYQQAAEAALDPRVLGPLRPLVERRIAQGASQSGGRLKTYINEWQEAAGVFDGFQPQVSSPSGVRDDLVPILWLNSSSEVSGTDAKPDEGLFRLWELAGPAHTTQYSNNYRYALLAYSHSNGAANTFDDEEHGAWGWQFPPGTCASNNLYYAGPIWGAALVTIDEWVKTGVAPASQPRVERVDGARVYDEHGNLRGGVRSAILDVPIATYYAGGVPTGAGPCGAVGGSVPLTGLTQIFDPLKMAELYPTTESYLTPFNAAVDAMLDAGTVLPEGAADLKTRAASSGIGGGFPSP
jgi:hypothetical protein